MEISTILLIFAEQTKIIAYDLLKLSVIIPVYQVEKYIHPCLESVFKQGLSDEDFEIIIVNDGTKDKSMEVIADLIGQHSNITIINQENQGLSVVRNNGMAQAKGEYILMLDSDDLLIEGSLIPLLEKALETKADLVVADFLTMSDQDIETYQSPIQQEFVIKVKTGEELYMEDLVPNQFYVWHTLYRKDFITKHNLSFIPGIYFQDVPFTHEAYLRAKKCIKTQWLLNIYRRRRDSASDLEAFSMKKGRDFCIAIAKSWDLYKELEGLSPETKNKQKQEVYTSYSNLLYRFLFRLDNISDQVNILKYLHRLAPDMVFNYSKMQRLGNRLYNISPYLYVIVQKWIWSHR